MRTGEQMWLAYLLLAGGNLVLRPNQPSSTPIDTGTVIPIYSLIVVIKGGIIWYTLRKVSILLLALP
jgi:hypothetical protein